MNPVITIRFIRTPGFVTSAICFVTNSLFDHVEFGTPEGTWIGAHAASGIQERPANYCQPTREYVYEIPCTQRELDELLRWARQMIGTPYDYEDIAGLLFHNRMLNHPGRDICSEFVYLGLCHIGIRALNVLPDYAYLVTPEMLHLAPMLIGHLKKKVG